MVSARVIRVLTADDHPLLREGVRTILEVEPDIEVVGEAGNGVEAVAQFAALRPDVTLMDLQMPRMTGLEAIAEIRKANRHARVIVLTTYAGDAQALAALRAGAMGYLLKTSLRKQLPEVIRAVHGGRRHLAPEIAQEIAFHAAEEALSERELTVLREVAAGCANKEIAWRLSISEDTVKAHLKNIFLKLGTTDRTHAVTTALRRGIIEL